MELSKTSRRVSVIAVATLALGGAAVVTSVAASAAPSIRTGPHINVDGHPFGSNIQKIGGKEVKVYCKSPGKLLTSGQTFSTKGRIPGVSAVNSARVIEILVDHGQSNSAKVDAAVYSAVNDLTLPKGKAGSATRSAYNNFHHWYKDSPASNRNLTHQYEVYSATHYGKYTVTVSPARAVLPGQPGSAVVTVKSARGVGVPGRAVAYRLSTSKATSHTRTNSRGQAVLRYTGVALNRAVYLYYNVSGLPPASIQVSNPRPGQQTLLTVTTPVSVGGHTGYVARLGKPKVNVACNTDCNGNPKNTISTCLPAGTVGGSLIVTVGRTTVGTTKLAAHKASCGSVVKNIRDRSVVSVYFRFNNGQQQLIARYVVDCPPVLKMRVIQDLGCDCNQAIIQAYSKVAIGQPIIYGAPIVNNTGHPAYVTINGKTTQLAVGQSMKAVVVKPVGSTITYTVTTGSKYATHAGYHTWSAHGTVSYSNS